MNVLIAGMLLATWAALTAVHPQPISEPKTLSSTHLVFLEDALAHDRGDLELAQEVAEAYLEMEMPGLAIGVLRDSALELSDSPMAVHRLAQAYEATGRTEDALATAERALSRCGSGLGMSRAANVGAPPAQGCELRDFVVFEMHRNALDRMVQWGVSSPGDARAQMAYEMALRRASIAAVY